MICYDCKEESLEGKTRCPKHHALALANGKLWRERNPDKAKASRQRYYQKNKEVIKENSKEWARNNKERKAIKSKEWAKNNPNKVLNSRMKKFNITADEYNQRLLDQDHKCAICNSDNPRGRGRFAVDHDHKKEREEGIIHIRGMLCGKCNLGLGYFDDNVETMKEAINYINNGGFGRTIKTK